MKPSTDRRLTQVARVALAITFVLAGAAHFADPAFYLAMMPPYLPAHQLLVDLSGVAEILLGLAVLHAPLRRWAGWGLMALIVAVFPANVYVAASGATMPGFEDAGPWFWWGRLPFQLVFAAFIWFATLRRGPEV